MQRVRRSISRGLARLAAHLADPAVREIRRVERQVDTRVFYGGIAELDRRHGYRDRSLTASELRVFSQNGEDGVLAEIFARIGEGDRYFVEFGAEDGVEGNTRFLREVLGWRGLYLESDPEQHERLVRRLDPTSCSALRAMVTPETIESLFEQGGVPAAFDLLSIDIDGQDYYVWQALEHHRPRVVVVEYNSALAAGRQLVERRGTGSWDRTDHFGASIDALDALGRSKGYRLVHAELAGVNAFFVADECSAPFADVVVPRRTPNFDLRGLHHRPDPSNRSYWDPTAWDPTAWDPTADADADPA